MDSVLGGGGQWSLYTFLNVDFDALHFHAGVIKINIFKIVFWEGGHKKSTLYDFDNVDNMDHP